MSTIVTIDLRIEFSSFGEAEGVVTAVSRTAPLAIDAVALLLVGIEWRSAR
jgi:hypothetical protein